MALEKLTNSAGVSELMKRGTSLIEEVKEFQKLSSLNILAKIQFIQGERDSAMAMVHCLYNTALCISCYVLRNVNWVMKYPG